MFRVPAPLTIAGWNYRCLTLSDFESICTESNVAVLRLTMPIQGFYTHYKQNPVIVLNDALKQPRALFVAFHELAHHLCHDPGISRFDATSINKAEYQANIIAACALIPQPVLLKYDFADIADEFNLPLDLILFRAQVWQRLQL